jgi:hypothetical protein
MIVVPDRETAERLANQFPGCRLEKLQVGIPEEIKRNKPGRKRKYACGTLYPAKKAGSPSGYVDCPSDDKLIELLSVFHDRCLKTKEENMLISPAIFDPNKCEGSKRAMGNIVFVRGIWLDLERGDLKPDEFPDLFPDTRMAIFNTYNHTPEARGSVLSFRRRIS